MKMTTIIDFRGKKLQIDLDYNMIFNDIKTLDIMLCRIRKQLSEFVQCGINEVFEVEKKCKHIKNKDYKYCPYCGERIL